MINTRVDRNQACNVSEARTRVMVRLLGALAFVVAFIATGHADTVSVTEQTPALFITLPMTKGFADATDALVETQRFVRDALGAGETVRLVDRPQDSDAILTVLGRGTGYVELTAALQGIDPNVVAPPVMLHANERYIEVMLTVGSCGEATTSATSESKSPSCYRKIFVGLGDHDVPKGLPKAAQNTWTICANGLAKDVEAWVTQNASRLLARRG
jgi:hypothetical protein